MRNAQLGDVHKNDGDIICFCILHGKIVKILTLTFSANNIIILITDVIMI